MASRETLLRLASQCEEARRGSEPWLNLAVNNALGVHFEWRTTVDTDVAILHFPDDATLDLSRRDGVWIANAWVTRYADDVYGGTGATAALALCAARLRIMAAMMGDGSDEH